MADDAAAPEGKLTESTEIDTPEASTDGTTESPETADTDSTQADTTDNVEDFDDAGEKKVVKPKRAISHVQLATIIGLVTVLVLGGLVGWLGYRAYEGRQAGQQRALYLQVGKQAAVNLTTIDFSHADADVERILASATDTFYDDFSKRSQPFIDVVKQAQSKSTGEVTAAGVESEDAAGAQILVAVTVNTSNAGAPEQQPRAWRMRITVKQVDQEAKVSNVEFVP
jgi:Mce-associated membrane protein